MAPTRFAKAAALAIGTIGAVAAFGAAAETWDMPMAYPDGNFHTQTGKAFASCVKVGTDGKLQVAVHSGGSLFKGSEIKRAVQTGQAPIGERLLSAHENEHALFGFDAVPFLATSFAASDKLWEAARPNLEALLAKQSLVLLYAVPWPPQGLYSKRPVQTVADMKGMKFRAYNSATARFAELTGAVPVQIEAAELSQALATGVAESFISSGSTGYDSKVWEYLRHFYDVQAWLPRNYVFANKAAWEGLPQTVRTAVLSCAAAAEDRGTTQSQELTQFYQGELARNGMTVVPPSRQLEGELARIGATMTEDWLKKAGGVGKAIIDGYRQN